MKFLKYLLIFFALIIVIFVIGVAFAVPSEVTVTRSAEINAPVSQVYNTVLDLETWSDWDAWSQKDTNMVVTFEGTKGEVGYSRKWQSDVKGVGTGSMTLEGMEENSRLDFKLDFGKQGGGNSFFTFEDAGDGGTIAVMGFDFKANGFFDKIVVLMADKMMGPDFVTCLNNLNQYVQNHAPEPKEELTIKPINISPTQFPGATLMAIRRKSSFAEMHDTFKAGFDQLNAYMAEKGAQPVGKYGAIWYNYDKVSQTADFAMCVPVAEALPEMDDIKVITLDPTPALVDKYTGPYDGLPNEYDNIQFFIEKNNVEVTGSPWEVYDVGPDSGVAPEEYVTYIYFPIAEVPEIEGAPAGDDAGGGE